jgi:hypothetical protein
MYADFNINNLFPERILTKLWSYKLVELAIELTAEMLTEVGR